MDATKRVTEQLAKSTPKPKPDKIKQKSIPLRKKHQDGNSVVLYRYMSSEKDHLLLYSSKARETSKRYYVF